MFGYGDRITLSLVNGADINGKAVPFNLRLPAAEDYEIPEDLSVVDVFEYQEGSSTNGLIVFMLVIRRQLGNLLILMMVNILNFASKLKYHQ